MKTRVVAKTCVNEVQGLSEKVVQRLDAALTNSEEVLKAIRSATYTFHEDGTISIKFPARYQAIDKVRLFAATKSMFELVLHGLSEEFGELKVKIEGV